MGRRCINQRRDEFNGAVLRFLVFQHLSDDLLNCWEAPLPIALRLDCNKAAKYIRYTLYLTLDQTTSAHRWLERFPDSPYPRAPSVDAAHGPGQLLDWFPVLPSQFTLCMQAWPPGSMSVPPRVGALRRVGTIVSLYHQATPIHEMPVDDPEWQGAL